ncbi:MAG: DUF4416 family protein [Spirochaetales bacterium]|nr:DUF4416 family protein [Spirochaetales bacterium]
MATAREFQKCALVVGVLSTVEDRRKDILKALEKEFGPIEAQSPVLDFPYTDYYDGEMGGRPVRYLLLFRNLIDPSALADIKTKTNEMELSYADASGNRRVNLDPGTLSLANFILATCKDRSHRIALRNGIYAETTLIYQDHDFQALPWTYADYRSEEVKAILRAFRAAYRRLLKEEK